MNIKIGINSPQIKDFGGAIDPYEVDIIELGFDRMDFLDEQKEKEILSITAYLASSFDTEFTIHAPHIDSRIEGIKIDFSTNNEKNFTVMEKVFKVAAKIGAGYIVVHPGSQNGRKKCLNLNILNLIHICALAEEYGVTLLLVQRAICFVGYSHVFESGSTLELQAIFQAVILRLYHANRFFIHIALPRCSCPRQLQAFRLLPKIGQGLG
jgi:sugar phosphate isomerase/epimerase